MIRSITRHLNIHFFFQKHGAFEAAKVFHSGLGKCDKRCEQWYELLPSGSNVQSSQNNTYIQKIRNNTNDQKNGARDLSFCGRRKFVS